MKNETRNKGLLIALGVAAGAVAGWYLNSDQGRKARRKSAEKINDWSQNAMDKAQHVVEKSKDYAQDIVSNAKQMASRKKEMIEEKMKSSN